jgi:FtsZ-interacting cell division protein ZipA
MNGLLASLILANPLNPLDRPEGFGHSGGLVLRDILLILGVGLALAIILIFWAQRYVRQSKKRPRHRHHHRPSAPAASTPTSDGAEAPEPGNHPTQASSKQPDRQHHHRRRRRRRRDHRSRNPSLAEAGGLPPRRSNPSPPVS